MSKKIVLPETPNLIVVPSLNRRQILGGLGAIALPIAGCGGDDGPGGPGGPGGAGGAAGAPAGGSAPVAGSGVGGSAAGSPPTPVAGSPAGGTPGVAGSTSQTAGSPSAGNGMAGSGVSGGAPVGGAPTAGTGAGGTTAGTGAGGSGGGMVVIPPWDTVPTCTASAKDGAGQGPFMIHDKEKSDDISMLRQDIRGRYNMSAEPGVEMNIHLRILSSKSTSCNMAPVADAEIYIWHTDGQGFYSGFGMPGEQKPDEPYAGTPGQNDLDNTDRFCRGVQVTNAEGVVSFKSIFPGWYNGRDVHIHFIALKKGSASVGRSTYMGAEHLYTTQFYFDPMFTASVHEKYEPYKRRTTLSAYAGAIRADESGNSGLKAKASLASDIVTAQMQIILDPKA